MSEFLHFKKKLRMALTVSTGSSTEDIELSGEMERDWSCLPENVQDLILDRLVSLADYVRYGAVCKSWLGVSLEECNRRDSAQFKKNVQSSLIHNQNHQLPMLMIPDRFDENKAGFYSVTCEKLLKFELSVPYHQRFIGSSFGWLISMDKKYNITLFNPFLSHNNVHHIPATKLHRGNVEKISHDYYIFKAVLSADPNLHPHDYILAIIYGEDRRLAFNQPKRSSGKPIGARSWFYLSDSDRGFSDIICTDDASFYALHKDGEILNIKFEEDSDNSGYAKLVSPFLRHRGSCFARYIVESCEKGPGDGDILQVLRYGKPANGGFLSYLTSDFQVFKLDRRCGTWVELNSLGDQVLFLGDNSSLSVLASDFPGCEPGAICYSFGFHPGILNRRLTGDRTDQCDNAVFNLENKMIRPHKISYDHALSFAMHLFPPIWIVPTFQAPDFSTRSGKSSVL